LKNTTIEEFKNVFGNAIDNNIAAHFGRFKDNIKVKEAINLWAFSALKSDVFSRNFTGLVFGGFGSTDLFPSLYAIAIDGIYFGDIKKKITNNVDIDRRGDCAAIVPFAQSEMVERFLFGVDSDLESKLLRFISASSQAAIDKVVATTGVDLTNTGLTSEIYTSEVKNLLERMKKRSQLETLDMVNFMPMQELAYTAEAFITLTSIKRKVSAQQETVGGPIDVAVITRNEGFIWIKRKHYFDTELNPGYHVRTFKAATTEGAHGRARTQSRRGRRADPVPLE